MVGFFKKLFGGGDAAGASPADAGADETYKDVEIRVQPVSDGSQWRVAGTLAKTIDGEVITRRFMRADMLPSKEEARTVALSKAKLIIDQNGPMLWKGDISGPC
ncbi:MAG: HlyU family transcriptional regulator [Ahrensia sp.]